MPGDTPNPWKRCSERDDESVSPLIRGENVRTGTWWWSFLVEPGLDEVFEVLNGLLRVRPLGGHPQLGTLPGG